MRRSNEFGQGSHRPRKTLPVHAPPTRRSVARPKELAKLTCLFQSADDARCQDEVARVRRAPRAPARSRETVRRELQRAVMKVREFTMSSQTTNTRAGFARIASPKRIGKSDLSRWRTSNPHGEHPKVVPGDDCEAWELLASRNAYDTELFVYAQELFETQLDTVPITRSLQ